MMTTFNDEISAAASSAMANVVQVLAKHYGFNYLEAMRMLGDDSIKPNKMSTDKEKRIPEPVEQPEEVVVPKEDEKKEIDPKSTSSVQVMKEADAKKNKKSSASYVKPKFPLPWTGEVIEGWCEALRPNGGLLSQCTQCPKKDGLCGTCFKQQQTNGKPKCGTVMDRLAADKDGITYKNPETGKEPICYGIYLSKQNITQEDAIAEGEKFGITIPDKEFVVPTKRKGRPPSTKPKTKGEDLLQEMIAKAVSAVSSSSESEEEEKPNDTVIAPNNTDEENDADIYNAETEDEQDVCPAVLFTHNGVKYIREISTNILYHPETEEAIGVWNESSKTITNCEVASSDEDDE